MNTGLGIKLLREHKQISRETMADLLSMSVATYLKIESGERIPNINEILIISEKFEIDPSFFIKKDGIFITNGNNSPCVGNGNIITMDQNLLDLLIKTMTKFNIFLDRKLLEK